MKFKKILFNLIISVLVFTLLPATVSFALVELPTSYVTSTPPEGYNITTPPEYIFRIPGYNNQFILLDDFGSSNADRYIMCKDYYGMHVYDSQERQKFDVSSNDLASFLNSDFLTKGASGIKLPQPIIDYINFQHVWVTEGGSTKGNCPNTYESTLGVGIISAYEYKNYCSRFGVSDPEGYSKGSRFTWWTRSGVNDSSGLQLVININEEKDTVGRLTSWSCSGTTLLRPTFYLKADFFKRVKIDAFTAGDAVLDMLNRDLTENELKSLYTENEILIIKRRDSSAKAEISIENDINTVISRADGAIKVNVTNIIGEAHFNCMLINETGSSVENIVRILENGESHISLSGLENGIYTAQITVTDQNGNVCGRLGTQITVASRSVNFENSEGRMLGVNSITLESIPLLRRMGVKNVRWGIPWQSLESSNGFNFEYYDSIYTALTHNGFNIYFTPQGANPLYLNDNGDKLIENDTQARAFANYVAGIAERYPEIKYFEISNEPNDGVYVASSEAYAKMLKYTAEALKTINPKIEVIAGAIALGGYSDFLADSLDETNYPLIDGISVHPYIHTKGYVDSVFTNQIEGFEETIEEFGSWKDLHISEMGWPTNTGSLGVSEIDQSINLVKQSVYSDIAGYRTNFVYNFRESGIDRSNGEHTFGIVRRDYTPKPSFLSMLEFYNQTGKFLGTVNFGKNTVAALYSTNGQLNAVCWSTSGNAAIPVQYSECFDIYGNPIESPVLSSSPIYLCGLSEDILSSCAEKIISDCFYSLADAYSPKLSEKINTLITENLGTSDLFSTMQSFYNIGSNTIAEYRQGKTSLTKIDLLNFLYEINKTGKLLSEIYSCSESLVSADAILINNTVYVKGSTNSSSEVTLYVLGNGGSIYHLDQTISDKTGSYSFTFPAPKESTEGIFSIRCGREGEGSYEEKTFTFASAPTPKNIISAASISSGMLSPIEKAVTRIRNRNDYSVNSALIWQCYFLNKWVLESESGISVTSINQTQEALQLTLSNYTDRSENGIIIIGKYANDNKFHSVKWQQNLTVPSKSSVSVFIPTPDTTPEKLFFWKGFDTLVPIINALELN